MWRQLLDPTDRTRLGELAWVVLAESIALSFLGALVGLGVSLAILNGMHLSIGTEGVAVNFATSPALFARGLGIALATGALAGLAPAIRSARAPIVASLRSAT